MTTLQPRLVRADTLDLQSHDAPSAKDHTRSPTFSPYQHGQTGSHHRETLRNAEESAYNERKHSPRVSIDNQNPNLSGQNHPYDSAEDSADEDQSHGTNGIAHHSIGYDNGEADEDQDDDDVDDDLMDKISSSPSIEDGKYSLPFRSRQMELKTRGSLPASLPMPLRGLFSRSCESLSVIEEEDIESAVHHPSEYEASREDIPHFKEFNTLLHPVFANREEAPTTSQGLPALNGSYTSMDSISDYLLPLDDPALSDDENFEDDLYHYDDPDSQYEDDEADWIDEEVYYEDDCSSDDEPDDFSFTVNSRFIDSGWGGECLRETEDIDFEFVYALHTFVATVEGQANATKGDTMVLLDDSNSYWWLVRVVKDGSIGYLPAEHIETPTERLARLNKHRNIDLSASMLGDNPEKSKNPLKKAMRRRNAKSVAFAAPTYYEPSLYAYSSDEEDEDGEDMTEHEQQQQVQQTEPISEDSVQAGDIHTTTINVNGSDDKIVTDGLGSPTKADASEQTIVQVQDDDNFQRSRNGVVRNTDSFFKDDTVETKKISLTPRLLRNDTDSATSGETERISNDTFDKVVGEDKSKDEKKKKERKGMLSGLFKRKDKKAGKSEVEEVHSPDDATASTNSKDSMESSQGIQSPERKPGKLQKTPKSVTSPKTSPTEFRNQQAIAATTTSPVTITSTKPLLSSGVLSDGDTKGLQIVINEQPRPGQSHNRAPSSEKRSIFSPITTALKSNSPAASDYAPSVKPVYAKKAKERFAIDGSDSEDDVTPRSIVISQQHHRSISPMRDSMLAEPRPDSAMQVSPIETPVDRHDQSYGHEHMEIEDEDATTPIDGRTQSDTASTSKPSPSLATHTPSTSRSTPTWSDASLRSYMDNDQDIRDLLIIVHDKSNVIPVGPDHPLMGGLFSSERTRLAEMQTQLDSMLTSWISKKNPSLMPA